MLPSKNISASLFSGQAIALFTTMAGTFLMLVSWWQSYPVYLHSPFSEIFSYISLTYWTGLALTLPSLLVLSFKGKRVQVIISSVLIFLTLKSSFYFFFPLSLGPDQFFQPLLNYYFAAGHMSLLVQKYPWPAFFILGRQVELVTGLPTAINVHLFVFMTGVLMATSIVLVAERRSVNAGAAVFGFTLLSYYFLNYQFAPQVLGFPLVLLLIAIDFRVPLSSRRSLVEVLLFTAVCFTHAFVAVFYLLYSFALMVWARKELRARSRINFTLGLLTIYITVLYFYTTFLPGAVSVLYGSFFGLSGYGEFSPLYTATSAATTDTLTQFLSRTTVVATAAVSVLVLVDMIRRRQLGSKDYSLATAGTLYLASGFVLTILGARAFQLLAVTASIPVGFLGTMRRKWAPIALIVLAVASVSLPLHVSYNTYLFQDPFTAQQTTFVASHFGTKEATTVFMESATQYILVYSQNYRGISVHAVNEFSDPRARLPSYDYYAITPGLIHNVRDGLSDVSIPVNGINGYNRIIDDGREWWIMYSRYGQAQ